MPGEVGDEGAVEASHGNKGPYKRNVMMYGFIHGSGIRHGRESEQKVQKVRRADLTYLS